MMIVVEVQATKAHSVNEFTLQIMKNRFENRSMHLIYFDKWVGILLMFSFVVSLVLMIFVQSGSKRGRDGVAPLVLGDHREITRTVQIGLLPLPGDCVAISTKGRENTFDSLVHDLLFLQASLLFLASLGVYYSRRWGFGVLIAVTCFGLYGGQVPRLPVESLLALFACVRLFQITRQIRTSTKLHTDSSD